MFVSGYVALKLILCEESNKKTLDSIPCDIDVSKLPLFRALFTASKIELGMHEQHCTLHIIHSGLGISMTM